MTFIHWFHHLFNPHCEICNLQSEIEAERRLVCRSCETLRSELDKAHRLNESLIDRLTPPKEVERPVTIPEEIKPKVVPWHVRRQLLEDTDRQRAEILRQNGLKIPKVDKITESDLDKELESLKNFEERNKDATAQQIS